MFNEDALMGRYEYAEMFRVEEDNGNKRIVLTGYFFEGESDRFWHKEDRNVRVPMEKFLRWKSRSPESTSFASHILEYATDVRDMTMEEAEEELEAINPKPLNLVSITADTPPGQYIDMTFASAI